VYEEIGCPDTPAKILPGGGRKVCAHAEGAPSAPTSDRATVTTTAVCLWLTSQVSTPTPTSLE
jgi:hypothetical protein